MSKPYSVTINQHLEVRPDKTAITWPAADGGTLPMLDYDAGDYIIGNLGTATSYTGADGTVITFGATFTGSSFSGTGSDNTSSTEPYSGPYAAIAPSVTNLNDEAFSDIELLGVADLVYDENTHTYPIRWFAGPSPIKGTQIAPQAVGYSHIVRGHHSRGHFVGGSLSVLNDSGVYFLFVALTYSAANDTYLFATDDGSGDGTNAGMYRIAGPVGPTAIGVPFIAPFGQSAFYASTFPSAAPGNVALTFTTLFPAAVSRTTTGGSLNTSHDYSLRWCYTKSWNGQTIESALSPKVDLTGNAGYVFDVGSLPKNWTGIRLYYCDLSAGGIVDQQNQLSSSAVYDSVAGTLTWTSTAGDAMFNPSYGYSAWPAGTDLTLTGNADIMKLGHLGGKPDAATGTYQIYAYNAAVAALTGPALTEASVSGGQQNGSGTQLPGHLHPMSVHVSHMQSFTTTGGTTPVTSGYVPTAVGDGTVTYQAQASGLPSHSGAGFSGILYYSNGGSPDWADNVVGFNAIPYFNTSGFLTYFIPGAAGAVVTQTSGQPSIATSPDVGDFLTGASGPPAFKNALRSGSLSVNIDASGNASGTVSFSVPFTNTPVVQLGRGGDWFDTDAGGKHLYAEVYANSVSTTQFTFNVLGAVNKALTTVTLTYIAADNG